MSTARSPARRLHRDQRRSAPSRLLEAARALLARRWPAERQARLPLPARLDRRGLSARSAPTAPSPRRRPTIRTRPIRPARRPPTIWRAPGTRPTACRCCVTNCSNNYGPLPLSREADPADDPQRAGGQAAAGLRRRRQRARLAVSSRTMPRALVAGAASAAGSGENYNVGGRSERTQPGRRRRPSATLLDQLRPGAAAAARAPDHASSPTGRATTGATPSTRARSSASSAGSRRRRFETGTRRDGALVSRQRVAGGARCASGVYGGERLGLARRQARALSVMQILVVGRDRPGRHRAARRALPPRGTRRWRLARAGARPRPIADEASPRRRRPCAPDVVVNAAAYTAVDQAESEPDAGLRGQRRRARRCWRAAAPPARRPLVHVSTDYVFDGTQGRALCSRPIRPTRSASTARSKLRRRAAVRGGQPAPRHPAHRLGLLRASATISSGPCCASAGERAGLRVVADQHGCPTARRDLAAAAHRDGCRGWPRPGRRCLRRHLPLRRPAGAATLAGFAAGDLRRGRGAAAAHAPARRAIATRRLPDAGASGPPIRALDCASSPPSLRHPPPPWRAGARRHPRRGSSGQSRPGALRP